MVGKMHRLQKSVADMTISATVAQYNCTGTKININYCSFTNETVFPTYLSTGCIQITSEHDVVNEKCSFQMRNQLGPD